MTALNLLPSRALGGISPASENDPIFDVDLRRRRMQFRREQAKYDPAPTRLTPFNVGDYCYADPRTPETAFHKGIDFFSLDVLSCIGHKARVLFQLDDTFFSTFMFLMCIYG